MVVFEQVVLGAGEVGLEAQQAPLTCVFVNFEDAVRKPADSSDLTRLILQNDSFEG